MKNPRNPTDSQYGIEGGSFHLVDLQTTIAGFEITLETLVEISGLLKRLDERLAQLSPELPQVGQVANGSQSLSGTFTAMLNAYQEAFAAMAAAARSAALLGIGNQPVALTIETNAPKAAAPAPAAEPAKAEAVAAEPAPAAPSAAPEPASAPEPPKAAQPAADGGSAEARKPVSGKANLTPVGSDASQRSSYVVAAGRQTKDKSEIVKPLKPIDMPNVENPVGPMICHGMGVIYAHGSDLKKHWPGQRDAKAALESPIPNERWRLLAVDSSLFCVRDDGVTVLSLGELHKEGSFQGKYIGQTHTASAWVGVQNNDGEIAIEFRDKSGRARGEAAKLGKFGDAKVFVVSSGESVYVAIESGELFRSEGAEVSSLPKANKRGSIVGLAVDSRGLIVTNQGSHGVVLSLLDQDGNLLGESPVVASTISHPPVLSADRAYVFDDAKGEVVTLSLDTLDVAQRKPLENVNSVARLLALQEDKGVTLAILAGDKEGRPTDVYLHSVESGANTKLCHVSAVKSEIGYADGHIAVCSTSSMQNMVQVFSVYGPAAAAKAA